jgi:hypothetical protein
MSLLFRLVPTSLTAASKNQWRPNDGTRPQLTQLAPDDVGTGGGTATLPGVLVAAIGGTGGIGILETDQQVELRWKWSRGGIAIVAKA